MGTTLLLAEDLVMGLLPFQISDLLKNFSVTERELIILQSASFKSQLS